MPSLPVGAGGLLAAARESVEGDGSALDAWSGEPRSLLMAALVRWGRQAEDAEDLVQELESVAVRTVRAGKVVDRELPWMAGVLGRLWLKEIRRRRREKEKEKEKERPQEQEGPLDALVREEGARVDHEKVVDACRALPPPYGHVLWWNWMQGLPDRAIRERLAAFSPVTGRQVKRLREEALKMAGALLRGGDYWLLHPGRYLLDRNHWIGVPLPSPWEQQSGYMSREVDQGVQDA
jgi:DNA-directed RNA polymerase specialized sigma24 family protein